MPQNNRGYGTNPREKVARHMASHRFLQYAGSTCGTLELVAHAARRMVAVACAIEKRKRRGVGESLAGEMARRNT